MDRLPTSDGMEGAQQVVIRYANRLRKQAFLKLASASEFYTAVERFRRRPILLSVVTRQLEEDKVAVLVAGHVHLDNLTEYSGFVKRRDGTWTNLVEEPELSSALQIEVEERQPRFV